jgi:hypothetical protein
MLNVENIRLESIADLFRYFGVKMAGKIKMASNMAAKSYKNCNKSVYISPKSK